MNCTSFVKIGKAIGKYLLFVLVRVSEAKVPLVGGGHGSGGGGGGRGGFG